MTTRTILFSALFTLTLGACDQAPTDTREAAADPDRGSLGKADHLEGSCAADEDGPVCGGPAPVGNCWCDDSCEDYGDCCDDSFAECGVGEGPVDCDDGSALHFLCDIKPPCDDGQVAAVQNGCFQCVEEDTCEPPPPPADCDDGSSLHPLCDIKPPCADGQVAAVINGCFQCVEEDTCEPPPPPADCDDGSSLHFLCDIKPPCADGEVAAVINSCFQCVDALTCE